MVPGKKLVVFVVAQARNKTTANRAVNAIGFCAAKTLWPPRQICNGGTGWPADAGTRSWCHGFCQRENKEITG